MKSRVVVGAFVLVAFPGLWLCQETCKLPQPGRCSSSNFTINSNEVCDVEAGSCSFTQSSGLCSYRQGCVDALMTNWTLEQGNIQARQKHGGGCGSDYEYSVLESPWLNISHPSCLKVRYRRTNPAALDVFLELRIGRVFFLFNRSDNAGHNKNTTFKTTVDPGVGKILLRAYGGGGGGRSVIYKVTLEPGHCTWPDDGGNGGNFSSVTDSNKGDGGNGENSNAVTDSSKGDGGNSNSALIPGVVAAVAVVIIVIIIIVAVILIRRRGRLKRDQNKSLTQQDRKDGIVASKPQDNNNHDYSEIRASHFFPAPEDDSGYFELEAVASHPPDPDFDPYEQIPGDAPGRAEGPEEDDYNHLNAGGLPVKANPQESGDDDDYHHINTPGSTTDPRTSSVYSLAQIQRNSADQPGLRYTYSQVNKKGRKTTVEDAPDPTNAYNRVNKKAQKPAVALKPPGKHGQSGAMTRKPQDYCLANLDEISDPYNRINTTTARNHPTTSDDNQDPATDPYNRIHLTSDPGQKGKSSSPNDDYNALDFDDPTHASRVAIGSYDHVRSNPDDEYSKTGFGKRLVIDSSYDHVELDS